MYVRRAVCDRCEGLHTSLTRSSNFSSILSELYRIVPSYLFGFTINSENMKSLEYRKGSLVERALIHWTTAHK
jgi:hypothetical protein